MVFVVVVLGCGRLIVGDAWWAVHCYLSRLVELGAWLARPAGAVFRLWRVAFLPFRACAGRGWLPFRGRRRWPIWIWRTCCDCQDWRGANDNWMDGIVERVAGCKAAAVDKLDADGIAARQRWLIGRMTLSARVE